MVALRGFYVKTWAIRLGSVGTADGGVAGPSALHPRVSLARLWGGPVRARGQVGPSAVSSLRLPHAALRAVLPEGSDLFDLFFFFRTKHELCP